MNRALPAMMLLHPCDYYARMGPTMKTHAGVAQKMFETLSGENININVISTSEIKLSVLIERKYLELAVRSLHDAFDLQSL